MSRQGEINIERIRYWQGQELRARDFRTQTFSEAELRWWHNRALHNTFGIRSGFHVSPVISDGAVTAFDVDCGVAYDCYGRELILQSARRVEVPRLESHKATVVTLLARYKPVSRRLARRSSIEAAELIWKPAKKVERDDGVPLARLIHEASATLTSSPAGLVFPVPLNSRIRYDDITKRLIYTGKSSEAEKNELLKLSSDSAYRSAITRLFEDPEYISVVDDEFCVSISRALSRPRLGRGETVAGSTPWEIWTENVIGPDREVHEVPLGVQVTIDTSAAGFTQTPVYFAWLQGALWDRTNVEFFPIVLAHIDNESISRFRFRLWTPRVITWLGSRARIANNTFSTSFLNFARQQGLFVCWLGSECLPPAASGCVEVSDCCCTEEA
jgi:hypothetical protein